MPSSAGHGGPDLGPGPPSTISRRTSSVNVQPCPGQERTCTSPPMRRAMVRTMFSPRPVPGLPPAALPRQKLSKTVLSSPGSSPGPLSRTSSRSRNTPEARRPPPASTSTRPRSVNLTALLTRLPRACRRRNPSPRTCRGRCGARCSNSSSPLPSAAGLYRSAQARRQAGRSKVRQRKRTSPCSREAWSVMSSTISRRAPQARRR